MPEMLWQASHWASTTGGFPEPTIRKQIEQGWGISSSFIWCLQSLERFLRLHLMGALSQVGSYLWLRLLHLRGPSVQIYS